jgi:peptidyl-prolyl cis-trans isomerase C
MRLAGACILLTVALAGCQKSEEKKRSTARDEGPGAAPQSNQELSAALAKVDGVTITVRQLQDSINRQSPYIRARYQSKEQKRVFLDNLIRFEVLAKEAERRGLDKDPEVIQTMKSAMITKLLKDELARGIKPEDVPEAEMKAHYEAHKDEFNKPEEVRVSAIILKKKRQADDVAALAKGEQGKSNKGFRDLVTKYSTDEETKLRGGDLRYFHRESTEVPKPLIEAAFGLEKTGDVTGPVSADGKFYVIKQTGRRKAVVKSYEQVKRQIQNDLYKDRREVSQKQFVETLRGKAKVEVFEDNLKKVRVDTSSKATLEPSEHGKEALGAPPPPQIPSGSGQEAAP